EVRLVDAYQGEVITLEELKERRRQVQNRRQALIAQRDQQARLRADQQAAQFAWQELTAFCERIRTRLDELTPTEKQQVLQLLVERIIVGENSLEIRHVILLRSLQARVTAQAMSNGSAERSDAEGASADQPAARLRSDRVCLPLL